MVLARVGMVKGVDMWPSESQTTVPRVVVEAVSWLKELRIAPPFK